MKKIFFLLFSLVFLSACQNKQVEKEDIITNQYHFYQDAINQAQNAQNQVENISVNVNEY